MHRLLSTIKKFPIIITDNAWNKIINISKTQKLKYFLFSAKSGGCNGFNYKFNSINTKEYNNIYNTNLTKSHLNNIKPTIIQKNNITILIDPVSEFLLLGTIIDYINEDYSNNIFENKFVFIPDKNITSSCGCGISFTPKK